MTDWLSTLSTPAVDIICPSQPRCRRCRRCRKQKTSGWVFLVRSIRVTGVKVYLVYRVNLTSQGFSTVDSDSTFDSGDSVDSAIYKGVCESTAKSTATAIFRQPAVGNPCGDPRRQREDPGSYRRRQGSTAVASRTATATPAAGQAIVSGERLRRASAAPQFHPLHRVTPGRPRRAGHFVVTPVATAQVRAGIEVTYITSPSTTEVTSWPYASERTATAIPARAGR